jgi:Papain-like cysteine protease AvrRpt2
MPIIESTLSPLAPHEMGEAAEIDDFSMQEQQYSNWCWAAVAASVVSHYGRAKVEQFEIAKEELGKSVCCDPTGSNAAEFNVTNVLGSPLNRRGCLQRCGRHKRAERDEIIEELRKDRPICVRTVWLDGGAHFVVIVGCWTEANVTWLALDDPFWGRSEYCYDAFANHYELPGGRWVDTYYTRRPKAVLLKHVGRLVRLLQARWAAAFTSSSHAFRKAARGVTN